MNTLRPDLPLSTRLALAEQALRSLVSDGLVGISRGSWEAQVQVPQADVETLLREYESWVASPDRELTFFAATQEGMASYFGSAVD